MDELPAARSFNFLNELSLVSVPKRSEIKDTCVKLSSDPIPSEYFWKLAFQIRFASDADLQILQQTITDLLVKNRLRFLSASFAASHFARRISTDMLENSDLGIPSNPEVAVKLLQSYTLADSHVKLNTLLKYLDYPSFLIQKSAAASISNCFTNPEDRKKLVESALAALAKSETISPLTFPFQMKDEETRNTGLLILCQFFADSDVSIKLLLEATVPFLTTNSQPSASIKALELLSMFMREHPTAFHPYGNQIKDIVMTQFENEKLKPEFLKCAIETLGIWVVKKVGIEIIPKIMDRFGGEDPFILSHFIPYLAYLPTSIQMTVHQSLVDACEKKKFDSQLFTMTTEAILALAPIVSPHCGRFINIAKETHFSAEVLANLKPLLEPNGPPPPHEVNQVVIVDEEDKRTAEVQVNPSVESIGIQKDTTDAKN
ncbi:hypothetical protein TRFO_22459 [Tritrichomonas foetus]|uniref:Uncharacterized protein n=1 Tax=Tritrichomonas foetus TaxID=1144522 RepID=A0A1J4KGE3_9EUKA|nr:hypothetical protein TRFO_22459 [Tritrichomonas foetus]|eukprot:OHT08876.1 hypothetical protein TRFO_22459 [Tritrichomonas foetus]